MMKRVLSGVIALLLFASQSAVAAINRSLLLQPRTYAMGGVGVGLADDEYALFNNVAGLAQSTARDFRLLGIGLSGSTDAYESYAELQGAFDDFSISSLSSLAGKNIYMRGGATPMIRLENFVIAYVVDGELGMYQYNAANPDFDLTSMTTHGVQAGYGFSLNQGRHTKNNLNFGVGIKMLWRKGGTYRIGASDLLTAASDPRGYIDNLMGDAGLGFGFDAGSQYVWNFNKKSKLSLGTSLNDIGNTKFSSSKATPIPMNWSLGVGYKAEFDLISVALGADVRDFMATSSFSNKLHFGASIDFPIFELYMGINQLYFTYGAAVDIWIVKLTAASSGSELGQRYGQNPTRSYLIQLDFKIPI